MSSVAYHPNLSCARCHATVHELGTDLPICQLFKPVKYCSEDCRDSALVDHKLYLHGSQMIALHSGQVTDSVGVKCEGEPHGGDTIYYIHTSTPHLSEIKVTGPFYPLQAVVSELEREFQACSEGLDRLNSKYRDTHGNIKHFDHITSPVDHDPNRTRTVKLLSEDNPDAASRMASTPAADVHVVVKTEYASDIAEATGNISALRSVIVCGTFHDRDAADFLARSIGNELMDGRPTPEWQSSEKLSMRDRDVKIRQGTRLVHKVSVNLCAVNKGQVLK